MQNTRYFCQMLIKLEFSVQIFEKFSNIKCHENQCSGSRVVPRGQTDVETDATKLVGALRNFASTPNNTGHT